MIFPKTAHARCPGWPPLGRIVTAALAPTSSHASNYIADKFARQGAGTIVSGTFARSRHSRLGYLARAEFA
jgi:hypothetical protein